MSSKHRVSQIVDLYEVSPSPALARLAGPIGTTPLLLITIVIGAETHRSGVALIDGMFRPTLSLRNLLGR
jgi:hypothetical protein